MDSLPRDLLPVFRTNALHRFLVIAIIHSSQTFSDNAY